MSKTKNENIYDTILDRASLKSRKIGIGILDNLKDRKNGILKLIRRMSYQ